MKSPTKEQVEEALSGMCSVYRRAEVMTAAYRFALARAELAERHERELNIIAEALDDQSASISDLLRLRKRHHLRERKELEA